MNPYITHTWMGADRSAIPPLPQLLTAIHALDTELQQTNIEIASQITTTNATFVNYAWRPFMNYWDLAMLEVYDYEGRGPKDVPPSGATALFVLGDVRAKYETLRQEAKARWRFLLHMPRI